MHSHASKRRIPGGVLAYGLAGVVPFWLLPLLAMAAVEWRGPALAALAAYGALIISFLGGARWGIEITRPAPRLAVVTLAMLPTLAGFALLVLPSVARGPQLAGIAALLALHFAWDARSAGLPTWYPGLRALLTAGAVTGLLLGALTAR